MRRKTYLERLKRKTDRVGKKNKQIEKVFCHKQMEMERMGIKIFVE